MPARLPQKGVLRLIRVVQVQTKDDASSISCRFEVQDTGKGIDIENKTMLFEPFHQGEQGAVSRQRVLDL